MKSLLPGIILLTLLPIMPANGADEAIDRLIKKLPPPEKFVDSSPKDPVMKQIATSINARNYGTALDLSRKFAAKYPNSLNAQMVHAVLALGMRSFPEAKAAYQKALQIHPDFPAAYFGLGVVESHQFRFAAALSDFQKITRIAPELEVGWMGCSALAEKLGRRQEGLEFAKRATVVAPSSSSAWLQLATAQALLGDKKAAENAIIRANQLRRKGK